MDGYEKLRKCSDIENQVKFIKGQKQYQYSEDNQEFIDLRCQIAHVGHSHPVVISAAQSQIRRLSCGQGLRSPQQQKFDSVISCQLPQGLKCYYMVNSGAEANDLAMLMARKHSKGEHFIVFKGAYHGCFTNLIDVSPKVWQLFKWAKPRNVHVVNPPDMYRGLYSHLEPELACDMYIKEVTDAIDVIRMKGGKLAGFISEIIATSSGVIVPPKRYYRDVYDAVRGAGGICIADETGCSLGRAGGYLWTFEHFNVTPDVLTVGKSLGNGYPVSLVCTSKDVANNCGQHFSTFGGNPVACAVSSAVLDVIDGEMVIASSRCVGKYLLEALQTFKHQYPFIGDIRGLGLCLGVEIVYDPTTKKPHPALAAHIYRRLLDNNCLVGIGGIDDNVLILTPPLCITQSNIRQVAAAFAKTLPTISVKCFDTKSDGNSCSSRKKCKYSAVKN